MGFMLLNWSQSYKEYAPRSTFWYILFNCDTASKSLPSWYVPIERAVGVLALWTPGMPAEGTMVTTLESGSDIWEKAAGRDCTIVMETLSQLFLH